MNNLELIPSYWASVSGGKDSLFMLNLILSNLDKYKLDGVIHFELEIDYPFIKDVIDYMENKCNSYGIPFIRIKPRIKWIDLYNRYGFPTGNARWCNSMYKLDCRKQFDNFKKSLGYKTIYYIGYCYDEFSRYENRTYPNEIYPLVNEHIIEDNVLLWAKYCDLFNDFYKYNKRCGCMFCPLQDLKNSLYLRTYYPEKFFYMMKLAKDTEDIVSLKLNRPFSVWSTNSKYDTIYRMDRVEKLYLSGYKPDIEIQTKLF